VLVISAVDVSINSAALAGHSILVNLARSNWGNEDYFHEARRTVTLDARGTGSFSLSFGVGSAFHGTYLCMSAQDLTTGNWLNQGPVAFEVSGYAHGFVKPAE
jgi:hypothetical protein